MSEQGKELMPGEIRPLPPGNSLSAEQMQAVALAVRELVTPIMRDIGKLLNNNTQAMEQIAAAQQMTNERMNDLEKQLRLNMPMTSRQAQFLNEAVRDKAREVLDKYGFADDKKAVTRLGNAIRKRLLARYGVSGVRDIPRCEYTVAMNQIAGWIDAMAVRDVLKEAKKRADATVEVAQQSAGVDGAPPDAREGDKSGECAVRSPADVW